MNLKKLSTLQDFRFSQQYCGTDHRIMWYIVRLPKFLNTWYMSKFLQNTECLVVVQGVAMKFLEWFYCVTWREPHDLIIVKTCLCIFQLALDTISMH
jgi:hypothetical protein